MTKKRNKNFVYIYPLLFLVFPFIAFFIISFIRFLKTDIFNYSSNFKYFYDVILNYKQYILPTLIFFTIALFYIAIIKILKQKTKILSWIFITILGIIIITCGNRLIFIISNNLWNKEILIFIFHEVNIYTFIFSCEMCFLASSLLFYFDKKYLKK